MTSRRYCPGSGSSSPCAVCISNDQANLSGIRTYGVNCDRSKCFGRDSQGLTSVNSSLELSAFEYSKHFVAISCASFSVGSQKMSSMEESQVILHCSLGFAAAGGASVAASVKNAISSRWVVGCRLMRARTPHCQEHGGVSSIRPLILLNARVATCICSMSVPR